MYLQINMTGLAFADILEGAQRKRRELSVFPYKAELCRCSFCRFFSGDQCVLKTCCCIPQRVKAGTCSFRELTEHCFVNVKNHQFRSCLVLAEASIASNRSCFLSADHKKRFEESIVGVKKGDLLALVQLYVLTASDKLWRASKPFVFRDGISYLEISFHGLDDNGYGFYCIAYDIANRTSHMDVNDLCNSEIVSFELFKVACCAVVISAFGLDAIRISEKRQRNRRNSRAAEK